LRRYRIHPNSRRRNNEQGVVITLVAVVMLFVVGAMAALSIDVVTLYTARSEAQLAADGAALAGARVLANSGTTSDTTGGSMVSAWNLAKAVAIQVATENTVGGTKLKAAEVTLPASPGGTNSDPTVTVIVQKNDLPTFFARIWGTKTLTVKASATAEAYNPTPTPAGGPPPNPSLPVAPLCVKPWLLPNLSPRPGAAANAQIFDPVTGAILDTSLLGWATSPGMGGNKLRTECALPTGSPDCQTNNTPAPWRYYPGTTNPADPAVSFPPPSASSVVCPGCVGFDHYQLSIAGCVQTPIACNSTVTVDTNYDATRNTDTVAPVNGMTHASAGGADSVDTPSSPPPFTFLPGADNPVVLSGALGEGTPIMVSDSLVTVPVINADSTSGLPPSYPNVQIIGFVQLFLNPYGAATPANGHIRTQVINLVGCGTGIALTPTILGNGASPVAVRLISPP
jgi:Flp pilus assembly protein TadG